jgi:hypothetical protein
MELASRPARTPSNLSDSLHQKLSMYALAAGVAGVAAMATAQFADARIVYIPANVLIPSSYNGPDLYLDLNHDGISDFVFSNDFSVTSGGIGLGISPIATKNRIFSDGAWAAALKKGQRIGPDGRFYRVGPLIMVGENETSAQCVGPWKNAHDSYLGLKFAIKGKVHFGWARLKVSCVYLKPINATLTGFAYETVPKKGIVAGKTKGTEMMT